ncbi:hypothetical protein PVAG01_06830 [Phlyctema vagabunda]|uniref:Fe2OG dioxygenase domain-containing protein n=1 Tax=Phlyctema vagabunda TaxID=108571 RepID=A0ABR4PH60_9HELO
MATETITKEELEALSFPHLPPFPGDIPTAPLHRLSLVKLRDVPGESVKLFSSSKDLGFFYLDLRGDELGERILARAEKLFDVGFKLYDLGSHELRQYDHHSEGSYVGYKRYGAMKADDEGNADRNEFYNGMADEDSIKMPKDDFLEISKNPYPHPQLLLDNKQEIAKYMEDAHELVLLILSHLNDQLHLPPDTLGRLHRRTAISGNQARIIKSLPQPESDRRIALKQHTDYGSITILLNKLGGLQILPPPSLVVPGTEPEWTYVKPLAGHCIVNLGDAMVKFTNGLLRSNIHRVVNPPGAQAGETRYSLAYFARPEDEVMLRRLSGSDIIPEVDEDVVEKEVSSKDWVQHRAMSGMINKIPI